MMFPAWHVSANTRIFPATAATVFLMSANISPVLLIRFSSKSDGREVIDVGGVVHAVAGQKQGRRVSFAVVWRWSHSRPSRMLSLTA